jgi:hypothetical protein
LHHLLSAPYRIHEELGACISGTTMRPNPEHLPVGAQDVAAHRDDRLTVVHWRALCVLHEVGRFWAIRLVSQTPPRWAVVLLGSREDDVRPLPARLVLAEHLVPELVGVHAEMGGGGRDGIPARAVDWFTKA